MSEFNNTYVMRWISIIMFGIAMFAVGYRLGEDAQRTQPEKSRCPPSVCMCISAEISSGGGSPPTEDWLDDDVPM
jgi:hypothetical protein